MPLPYYKTQIEVLFRINDSISVLQDIYFLEDIHIDEHSFTLLNVSDKDRNLLLSKLREVRLEKLLNNNDVPIQTMITHFDRVGNITRIHKYKVCLDSNLTFNIKEREIEF